MKINKTTLVSLLLVCSSNVTYADKTPCNCDQEPLSEILESGYDSYWGLTQTKDLERAFYNLEKASKMDSNAKFIVGTMYFEGDGVEQDYAKAFKIFTELANDGNKYAQYNLALMYLNNMIFDENIKEKEGVLVDKNNQILDDEYVDIQIKKLLVASAKQNFIPAQYTLIKLSGEYLQKSRAKNTLLELGEIAKNDSVNAQTLLATIYAHGYKIDYTKAANWLYQAILSGNENAQLDLIHMYLDGKIYDFDDELFFKLYLGKYQDTRIFDKNYYMKDVLVKQIKKNIYALNQSKDFYNFIEYDLEKMEELDLLNISLKYFKGDQVFQNKTKAIEILNYLAEKNFSPAQYNLALIYWNGDGVVQNRTKAIRLLKESNKDESFGQYFFSDLLLAKIYEKGLGVDKNERIALSYYQNLASQGYKYAEYKVLKASIEQNYELKKDDFNDYIATLISSQSKEALILIGDYYEKNIQSNKTRSEPVDLYIRALAFGSNDAKTKIAKNIDTLNAEQLFVVSEILRDGVDAIVDNNLAEKYLILAKAKGYVVKLE